MNIVGDVKGKDAVIVDDMIDTAGTLTNAAKAIIKPARATRVGLRDATRCSRARPSQRITDSPLAEVVVTNTIPLVRSGSSNARRCA